jgi:hypothetical protein
VDRADDVPVPSTWPCTTCPPKRSAARKGSSRFTRAPTGATPPARSARASRASPAPAKRPSPDLGSGQAHAVDGDRVALVQLAASRVRSQRGALPSLCSAVTLPRSAIRPVNISALPGASLASRSPLAQARGDQQVLADALAVEGEGAQRLGDAARLPSPPGDREPRFRRAAAARGTGGFRRSRPRPGTRRRGAGRPPAAPRVTPSAPSCSSPERTRAGSFSPVATSTCTPAASSASVSARAAARETTTVSGISAAAATSWEVGGRRASESNTTRRGWWGNSAASPSGRAVSRGSSASAVPMPTTTASTEARQR